MRSYVEDVTITGVGHYLPSLRVSNEELVVRCPGVNPAWTKEVLGIEYRRIARQETTSAMAYEAAMNALLDAGYMDGSAMDLIVVATSTPDRLAPSTSSRIHTLLHAKSNVGVFDINAVCAGFICGLSIACNFIRSGAGRRVLVIGADRYSTITNWEHRDCVFFGDGAGAVIVEADTAVGDGLTVQVFTSTDKEYAWTVPAGGSEHPATANTVFLKEHYFKMNGRAVYDAATKFVPEAVRSVLHARCMTLKDMKYIVPHQTSKIILQKIARELHTPFEKMLTNMVEYANTSAASIPIMLSEAVADGRIVNGDWLVMPTIGAGWVYGAAAMCWTH